MRDTDHKWEASCSVIWLIVAPSSLFLILLLCRLDHVGSVPIPLAAIFTPFWIGHVAVMVLAIVLCFDEGKLWPLLVWLFTVAPLLVQVSSLELHARSDSTFYLACICSVCWLWNYSRHAQTQCTHIHHHTLSALPTPSTMHKCIAYSVTETMVTLPNSTIIGLISDHGMNRASPSPSMFV